MWDRALKTLVLFCLCHIEIHVKAEVLQVPERCWKSGGDCALQSSAFEKLESERGQLMLEKDSLLKRNASGNLNVIEGSVYVNSLDSTLLFDLPQGRLEVFPKTKVQVKRLESGVGVGVLEGEVKMSPHGKTESVLVPAGYAMSFEWVNASGEVVVDIPRSLSRAEWIPLFYSFHQEMGPSELKAQLEKDIVVWRVAVEAASQMQKSFALRSLAEADAEKQRRHKLKVQREAEDQRLREMFRRKNYY